jgi:hypothetical protein
MTFGPTFRAACRRRDSAKQDQPAAIQVLTECSDGLFFYARFADATIERLPKPLTLAQVKSPDNFDDGQRAAEDETVLHRAARSRLPHP